MNILSLKLFFYRKQQYRRLLLVIILYLVCQSIIKLKFQTEILIFVRDITRQSHVILPIFLIVKSVILHDLNELYFGAANVRRMILVLIIHSVKSAFETTEKVYS